MPLLSAEQFNDWLDHYDENPWGGTRDDLRMEAFRLRLLHSLGGSEDGYRDVPGAVWPYKSINDSTDWEAVINEAERLTVDLVDDGSGTGRMKWKDD